MSGQDAASLQQVLLTDVDQLTFSHGKMAIRRRTAPIPQLVCDPSGPAGCPSDETGELFRAAVCRNIGVAMDGKPRWKCSADVPAGLAMGFPEITCEGYDYREDSYVLTESCSLLYSLEFVTTGTGRHARFRRMGSGDSGFDSERFLVMCSLFVFIARLLRLMSRPCRETPRAPPAPRQYRRLGAPVVEASTPPTAIVTGRSMLPTAVPISDVENPPSGSAGHREESAAGSVGAPPQQLPAAVAVDVTADGPRALSPRTVPALALGRVAGVAVARSLRSIRGIPRAIPLVRPPRILFSERRRIAAFARALEAGGGRSSTDNDGTGNEAERVSSTSGGTADC